VGARYLTLSHLSRQTAEKHHMTDFSHTSGIATALVSNRDAKIKRAVKFLRDREAPLGFPSFISSDPSFAQANASPEEIFTPMLVLNAFADAGLSAPDERLQLERVHQSFTPEGLVHFFADRSRLVADIDCTCVALELMVKMGAWLPFDIDVTLDTIAANVDAMGVLRVYIGDDPSRQDRVDAAVCVNALYLFYLLEREGDVAASEEFIWEHLTGPNFAHGTRYYSSPDIFLLFLSRLVRDFAQPRWRFTAMLEERLRERFGAPDSNVLELAARVSAAANIGLVAEQDIGDLVRYQRADGSWPAAPCFRFGRQERYFGGDSLSTAWGVRALAVSDGGLRSAASLQRGSLVAPRFDRLGESKRESVSRSA
jgi:hypothetical protein